PSAGYDSLRSLVDTPCSYGLDGVRSSTDGRHALFASASFDLPWSVTFGAIWQLRSSLPFSAFSAVLDADGVRQYVPGTSRNQGDRDLSLAPVNTYRATLNLAPIPASQIDSSLFSSLDVRASRPIFVRNE